MNSKKWFALTAEEKRGARNDRNSMGIIECENDAQ